MGIWEHFAGLKDVMRRSMARWETLYPKDIIDVLWPEGNTLPALGTSSTFYGQRGTLCRPQGHHRRSMGRWEHFAGLKDVMRRSMGRWETLYPKDIIDVLWADGNTLPALRTSCDVLWAVNRLTVVGYSHLAVSINHNC